MNTAFASYVTVAWVLLAVIVFPSFPARRGMILIMLSGLLFLPQLSVGVVELGPLKFNKQNSICYALFLCCLMYDSHRLFAIKMSLVDLPVLLWSFCPALSILLNDPPPDGSGALYGAGSTVFIHLTNYLIPYLIGRLYFADSVGMLEFARGVVVGALVYVPLCLYEIRMSPQLHSMIYGFTSSDFIQQVRFGGYRPTVFLGHGLGVAFYMAVATVLAAIFYRTSSSKNSWYRHSLWVLSVTLLLCKSVGSILLAGLGSGLLMFAGSKTRQTAILCIAIIPPGYCVARMSGYFDGMVLVQMTEDLIDKDRAQSLGFRFQQENMLIAKALERPEFGWGGWGRNRVLDKRGKDLSVTDGLWIIILGNYGIFGLVMYGAMVLIPVVRFAHFVPSKIAMTPPFAVASGFALILEIWAIDSLPNATAFSLFVVMAGGLSRFPVVVVSSRVPLLGALPAGNSKL